MVLILYISGADIGFVSLDPAANDSLLLLVPVLQVIKRGLGAR